MNGIRFSFIVGAMFFSCNGAYQENRETSLTLEQVIHEQLLIDSVTFKSQLSKLDTNFLAENIQTGRLGNLAELFSTENRLFFYFSFSHCDACVKRELERISHEFKKDELIIICQAENKRDAVVLKQLYSITGDFYFIQSKSALNISAEAVGKPFYFFCKKDRTPINIRFVEYSFPQLSASYRRWARNLIASKR